jgi:hypothetical protein
MKNDINKTKDNLMEDFNKTWFGVRALVSEVARYTNICVEDMTVACKVEFGNDTITGNSLISMSDAVKLSKRLSEDQNRGMRELFLRLKDRYPIYNNKHQYKVKK